MSSANVPGMIVEGVKRRSLPILDYALDNIVPPFSVGFALVIALLLGSLTTTAPYTLRGAFVWAPLLLLSVLALRLRFPWRYKRYRRLH